MGSHRALDKGVQACTAFDENSGEFLESAPKSKNAKVVCVILLLIQGVIKSSTIKQPLAFYV